MNLQNIDIVRILYDLTYMNDCKMVSDGDGE